MAHLIDDIAEAWHTRAWGASCRSTSGKFFKYQDGTVILPSDFVQYACENAGCGCGKNLGLHRGRVVWCGLDFTNKAQRDGAVGREIVIIARLM